MGKFNWKVEQIESRTNWKSNRLLERTVFDYRGSTVLILNGLLCHVKQ